MAITQGRIDLVWSPDICIHGAHVAHSDHAAVYCSVEVAFNEALNAFYYPRVENPPNSVHIIKLSAQRGGEIWLGGAKEYIHGIGQKYQ